MIYEIDSLINENDKNFSDYISENTLPKDYQEEAERISQYVTSINKIVNDLSNANFKSLIDNGKKVNGREQKKIEEFLNKENINTKAFD